MRTRQEEFVVWDAGKKFMVLATVAKNVVGMLCPLFIINHVPNYPLGCTIPYTQNILLFSFPNRDLLRMMSKNIANAKSAKKIVLGNTVIVVHGAILTFTSDVLIYHPPWNLKSTTTN